MRTSRVTASRRLQQEALSVSIVSPVASGRSLYHPGVEATVRWTTTGFAPTDPCRVELWAWSAYDTTCTNHR